MADALQASEWNHTAVLAVLLAEPNRDKKKKSTPFDIYDFNLFLKRPKRIPKSGAALLATLASIDGIQPETVTESTPWLKHQT